MIAFSAPFLTPFPLSLSSRFCFPTPNAQGKYQAGQVSGEVLAKLRALSESMAAYDFKSAQKVQMELATMEWNATKEWQKGVRHIVTLALIKTNTR